MRVIAAIAGAILFIPAPATAIPLPISPTLEAIEAVGGLIDALTEQPPGVRVEVELELERLEIDGVVLEGVEIEIKVKRVDALEPLGQNSN